MDGDKRLLAILSKLREDIETVGTREPSLKVEGGYRGRNLRKLLEVTFRGMDLNLVLEEYEQEEIRAGTQMVIVKGGGKSYAKLLKQIKDSVDTKKKEINVISAKKFRGKDLILEVAGKELAERLRKTILARTEENTVEDVRGYQVQVDIFDIDGDVTKEEILRHSKNECKRENRADCCYRCGKEGHQAREYSNLEAFCFTCKEAGHKADTLRCPEYRKLILEKRKPKRDHIRGEEERVGEST
ncbi:unnamed protein product [Diabrotica balteata]|uniref:CCHC-type domain-containing protein n=1 Tax=Diabrotica balteata TaxID=107213 RepID=A0A9N9SRJ3_DIABA|nr:unnamed protein product [Diabrotica balteata]